MNPQPESSNPIPHEEVARRAYALWQELGQPEGQADRHWLEAEGELRRARASAPVRPADEALRGEDGDPARLGAAPPATNLDRGLPPAERARERTLRHSAAGPDGWSATEPARAPEHFIVTLDRALLRIFREQHPAGQAAPALTAVEIEPFPAARQSYASRDTDQQGRFPGSRGLAGGMSIDERLPMQEENERRIIAQLAAQLTSFLGSHPHATWDFAAGPALHHPVLERLEPSVRRRLRHGLDKNLAHIPAGELREHFVPVGAR